MSAKDYLVEKKGEGDAETKELEALLGQARFAGMELPAAPRRRRRWPYAVAGLAAAAMVAFAVVPRGPFFEASTGERLYVGRWFEPATATTVKVADIGELNVQAGARLRLTRSDAKEHRLELAQGTVHAKVNAPPRLFVIDTPRVMAVDLGCEYDLSVEADGATRLAVRSGWVELEGQGMTSVVPAGMVSVTRRGPGMPVSEHAPEALRTAVDRFDAGDATALEGILAHAQAADAVTVWHLLQRVDASRRALVYARLEALLAPAVDKAQVLALEKPAMDALWDACTAVKEPAP